MLSNKERSNSRIECEDLSNNPHGFRPDFDQNPSLATKMVKLDFLASMERKTQLVGYAELNIFFRTMAYQVTN
jgi:hypothetical protein